MRRRAIGFASAVFNPLSWQIIEIIDQLPQSTVILSIEGKYQSVQIAQGRLVALHRQCRCEREFAGLLDISKVFSNGIQLLLGWFAHQPQDDLVPVIANGVVVAEEMRD